MNYIFGVYLKNIVAIAEFHYDKICAKFYIWLVSTIVMKRIYGLL